MENENKVNEMDVDSSFVDAVLGGESHSPIAERTAEVHPAQPDDSQGKDKDPGQTAAEEATRHDPHPEPGLVPDDADEDYGFEEKKPEDSKPEEKPAEEDHSAAEVERLKGEIETLNKRLHDTQASFHRVSEERAAMQRELDELKKREEGDDDWFSQEDAQRKQELEAEISKADKALDENKSALEDARLKAAEITWDIAAAPVAAKHKDFEELVYDFLGAKLDAQNGDPIIRAAWQKEADKSPAKAYDFAKRLKLQEEILKDPDAYKKRLREEILNEKGGSGSSTPTGKQGLDMVNSASPPPASPESIGSFVDSVFK